MTTFTNSLLRLRDSIESLFPPARVNRDFVKGIRIHTRLLNEYIRCLRWRMRGNMVQDLRLKQAGLVARLENMDESVEQALERTGAHYEEVKGKAKALADARNQGLRYYATSQLLDGLKPDVSGKVLEIACNTGLLSIVIKSEHPHLDCHAMDINAQLVAMASVLKSYLDVDVDFRVGPGQQLAQIYGDMKFDYIFICELLEHLESGKPQQDILDAACSLCSADGQIFVTVPYKNRIPFPGHITIFHRDNLARLLRPYAKQLIWHEDARHNLGLEKHFVVSFEVRTNRQRTK